MESILKKRNEMSWQEHLLVCLFIVGTFLLFYKLQFDSGITAVDECTYVLATYRLYLGDALFVDSWTVSQLSGLLTLPILAAYMKIVGSTEGIILFYRILYTVFKLVVALFTWNRLRKFNQANFYAAVGIGFVTFFSLSNVDSMSYNTVPPVIFMYIMAVIITGCDNKWDSLKIGILLSIVLMYSPQMLFVAILLLAIFIVTEIFGRNIPKREVARGAGFLMIGVLIVSGITIAFVLSRASISEIMTNMPYIIGMGSDHTGGVSVSAKVWSLTKEIIGFKWLTIINVPLIIINIIFKKKYLNKCVLLNIIGFVLSVLYMRHRVGTYFTGNHLCLAFLWFSIEILILLIHQEGKQAMKYIVCFGMGIADIIAICWGTDTGMISVSASVIVLAPLACFMLGEIDDDFEVELKQVCMLGVLVYFLLIHTLMVWCEGNTIHDYKYKMEVGPMAGIYVWDGMYEIGNNLYNIFGQMGDIHDEMILFDKGLPIIYLYSDGGIGMPNTYYPRNIEQYHEVHPERRPTIMYFHNNNMPLTDEDREDPKYQEYLSQAYDVQMDGKLLFIDYKD